MKTPNYDKQAEKFFITLVKKLKKNINVIDITSHDVPYQLLRVNHIPFYFENKSQTSCTRNAISAALYFCKVVPNAAVFIVVFQVYVYYFISKFT